MRRQQLREEKHRLEAQRRQTSQAAMSVALPASATSSVYGGQTTTVVAAPLARMPSPRPVADNAAPLPTVPPAPTMAAQRGHFRIDTGRRVAAGAAAVGAGSAPVIVAPKPMSPTDLVAAANLPTMPPGLPPLVASPAAATNGWSDETSAVVNRVKAGARGESSGRGRASSAGSSTAADQSAAAAVLAGLRSASRSSSPVHSSPYEGSSPITGASAVTPPRVTRRAAQTDSMPAKKRRLRHPVGADVAVDMDSAAMALDLPESPLRQSVDGSGTMLHTAA